MNIDITRPVVSDLWPLYVSGEAHAETKALVDAFLASDLEFAQVLRASAGVVVEAGSRAGTVSGTRAQHPGADSAAVVGARLGPAAGDGVLDARVWENRVRHLVGCVSTEFHRDGVDGCRVLDHLRGHPDPQSRPHPDPDPRQTYADQELNARHAFAMLGRSTRAMKLRIIGGGPAGLFFAYLMARADARHDVRVYERDPESANYGWLGFSDVALSFVRDIAPELYESDDSWPGRVRCDGDRVSGPARHAGRQHLPSHGPDRPAGSTMVSSRASGRIRRTSPRCCCREERHPLSKLIPRTHNDYV